MSHTQTRDELASAELAHELKNVLQVAHVCARVLRRHDGHPELGRWIEDLEEALARAIELSHRLIGRNGSGPVRLDSESDAPVSTDLAAFVIQERERFASLLGEQSRLELHVPAVPIVVPCAAAELDGLLVNLLLNCRDALPRGGSVSIAIDADATAARVRVHDDGVGMDAVTLGNAFRPYFTTKGEKGSGLGLYSVWIHVRALGGQATIDSAPGAGTTVTLTLPVD
jgi:signal transduction histidine kinase